MKKIFAILILTFAFTTGMLLTVAPAAAQAGLFISLAKHAAEDVAKDAAKAGAKDAAKAGAKVAEGTANGIKIENKGVEATATATVASAEVNGVKVEATGAKIAPGIGGGGDGGGGGGGGDGLLVWFYVLCGVGVVGGLLLFKFRGKRA